MERVSLDLTDLPDPVERKDPKETVVTPDLPVALVRLEPLEPPDLLVRRVALVLTVLL